MTDQKFKDLKVTAKGEERAYVDLQNYKTLWFNTGTLCNLSCQNCYIESSPTNDRLVYISDQEVQEYLNEIKEQSLETTMIGLTGGEPFLNPMIISIMKNILKSGFEVLVLTNALRVLKKHHQSLIELKDEFNDKLHLRISLDHHTQELHEKERGTNTFIKTLEEIKWLHDNGFNISIASRSLGEETIEESKNAHNQLLNNYGIKLDLNEKFVVFPEMKSDKELPEITTQCWNILKKSPGDQMCASERMIVKRKGQDKPVVMPCTLLAYDDEFVLGTSLRDADKRVYLNHRFCAEFCVLGGASCSSTV